MFLLNDVLHLFFPHVCPSCGTDSIRKDAPLCMRCTHALPRTNFHLYDGNPVEKHFWGRLPLRLATAFCHFSAGSMIQQLLHELKYRGNTEIGFFLGRLMGESLRQSARFESVEMLVPLPLYPSREKKRGYNQAALLCKGMAEVMKIPVYNHALGRISATKTQTTKTREERWQNMQGRFTVTRPDIISGKHVLLVDDIVTTGATLEACGQAILQCKLSSLSIATLAYAV